MSSSSPPGPRACPPMAVIWRHAFGNILVRLVTVVALAYAGLLEGAVLTETIFSWPGLGQYLTGIAAQRRHERRPGRHAGRGAQLRGAEFVRGPDVSPARPEGALSPTPDLAADGHAGLPLAGRLGPALSAVAAVPAQPAGDGRAYRRPGADRVGVARRRCSRTLDPGAQNLAQRLAMAQRRRTGSARTSWGGTCMSRLLYRRPDHLGHGGCRRRAGGARWASRSGASPAMRAASGTGC